MSNVERIEELAGRWRTEADVLRRRGAPGQAEALETAAEDLEERIREWELEALTMDEAADESGYSRSSLERHLAEGKVPNAGHNGAPRIRRRDLPRKPGHGTEPTTPDGLPDVAGAILAGET